MLEKSPSNPFIDAVDWEAMAAFMNLRYAGLFAGIEALRSAVERDVDHDEEYVDEAERHDVDPTTQLFV